MPNSSHSLRPTSNSTSANVRAAPADAVGDVAALLPPPAAALASLMRAAYSALHLEAVQRLPASCLPLWPRQMMQEETMRVLRGAKRQRSAPALGVAVATGFWSPPRGCLDTWICLDCPDMFGYVWICLDMSGYLDSLDMSGHICFNSGLRVVLTRINSGLRVVLTQGVLTACQR